MRVGFDSQIKLEFHGANVTSDAGLVAYRELDETLGLTGTADDLFRDPRRGKNTQHELIGLLWQSVYSRLAGYEDTNDAERLAFDPAMRQVVGGRAKDRQGASTSQMGRFETEILTAKKNLKAMMDLPGTWIDRVRQRRALDKLILDVDSSVSETYGRQEGSAYNGHFECTCYHPIFCFNHMTRQAPQNGSRCDDPRGCPAPTARNEAEKPPWHPGERPASARKTVKPRKWDRRNGRGRWYNNVARSGGVAGRGQMGNVGLQVSKE